MPLRLRPKRPLDLGIMHVVRTGTDQKHLLAWSVKIKRRKPELPRLPILWHASATLFVLLSDERKHLHQP